MNASLNTTLINGNNIVSCSRHHQKFKVVSCGGKTMESGERASSMDFHKMLSTNNVSVGEIKKAYRKMALKYHPDVCESFMKEESTKMFVELQEAYRSLVDQKVSENHYKFTSIEEKQSPERISRSKWETQLHELNRRSQDRRVEQDGSWGCRMRARYIYS